MRVGKRELIGAMVLAAVGGLSGCATVGQQSGAGTNNRSVSTVGQVSSFNGIQLTEVTRSAFPVGKFKGFPIIAQRSDFAALNTMSREYAQASWNAAAQKDWESFLVNRHLGMRLVEYRLHQKLATTAFVDSMVASSDGSGVLAPGATIFLPGFTRWGGGRAATSAQKVSSIESITRDLERSAVFTPAWESAPRYADLGSVLNVIKTASDVMAGGAQAGGARQIAAQKQANDLLAQLPVGKVFSARDAQGNGYLVERTVDGFIVGNAGERPAKVALGKLGYMPDMPMPDSERQAAAPLVMAMQESRHTLFWQAVKSGKYAFSLSSTEAPNKVVIRNTQVNGFLDADGRLATTASAIAAGEAAYSSRAGYKTALEMANYWKHRIMKFEGACFGMPGHRAYDTDYVGEYAEILQHKCLSDSKAVLMQQDFYVVDGKTMQTFDSLLKDKRIAESIKSADANRDLAESVVGFVPAIGDLDSAAKCLTGTSITNWSSRAVERLSGTNEVYRAFVTDLLPKSEDASVLSKSLTCASAVPVLGSVTKGVAKAGKLADWYKVWQKSEEAQDIVRALAVFDTDVMAVGEFAALRNLPVSPKAMTTMKSYYEKLQLASGGVDLLNSAAAVAQ